MAHDIETPAEPRSVTSQVKPQLSLAAIRQRMDRMVAAHASAAGWTGEDVQDIARRGSILFFSALSRGNSPAEALEHAAGNAENEYAIESPTFGRSFSRQASYHTFGHRCSGGPIRAR